MTTSIVYQSTSMADESSCNSPINSSVDHEDDSDIMDDCKSCRSGSCSSYSSGTATTDEYDCIASPLLASRKSAVPTAPDFLGVYHLSDTLDTENLVAVLEECLSADYVRGCVIETWDAVLSDHLEAIAHLVLYQSPDHMVGHAVYEQLSELSVALQPPSPAQQSNHQQQRQSTRVDAERVYGTLRSAARSLLTTRVDACCRQSMFRAIRSAVIALRLNTRPVFSVENFLIEINDAANFANLYCTEYARRICAALKDIYDTVMDGDYHPTNVVVQMAVMEKSIQAALQTLANAQATGQQKIVAQQSLLAELDDICATVRMKNYGCLDGTVDYTEHHEPRPITRPAADHSTTSGRSVYFTISPWRVPIRMYHQQSPSSIDNLLKSTVRLVEMLVSDIFKPCLNNQKRSVKKHQDNHKVQDKHL